MYCSYFTTVLQLLYYRHTDTQVAGHCGVAIPAELVSVLEAAGTDAEAVRVAGSAYMQVVAAAVLAADDPVSFVCVCVCVSE